MPVKHGVYFQTSPLPAIHIIVKNGRATLMGVVDNEGDKTIANVRANTVPGLFEVKNELFVDNRRNKMR